VFRGEGLERGRSLVHEPVAPAFRAAEPCRVEARGVGPGIERGPHGLEVHAAHQLGDELLLADEGAPAGDAARERNGIRELLGQAEALDEVGRRVDETVRQVLDGLGLSFQFTLGRRRDTAGQLTAAHPKILPRAPIQAARPPVQSRGPI
jgi:hypothetical protein